MIKDIKHNLVRKFREPYPYFELVKEQAVNLIMENNAIDMFNNPDGQLAMQTQEANKGDLFAGIGKSTEGPLWEQTFKYIQPSIKGTPIEDYINWLDVEVYRTRLMVCRPKSCYSFHADHSPRLHLPLVTNKQCHFIWRDKMDQNSDVVPYDSVCYHLPADGTTYWTDTTVLHSFMNGSIDNRFHLVMIVKE